MTIVNVGVVGCGLMGAGIAEVSARAGKDVVVVESSAAAAEAGRERLHRSLERAEQRGKIDSAADVLARIRVVDDLAELADRDLVVEAIVEDEQAKVDLFRRLDEIVASPDAILASNTSSIPIMKLGGRHHPSDPRAGHPLLQPGAGAVAGRAGAQPAHLPRHHRTRSRASSRTTSASRRSTARTAPASSSTRC